MSPSQKAAKFVAAHGSNFVRNTLGLEGISALDRVNEWLNTWAPNCGAPRDVFEGQFRVILREIFDEIESRAEANMIKTHKLEGMHYAAMKDVRRELGVERDIDL